MSIFLYVNGTDRTVDLRHDSLRKTNQQQQRSDTLDFTIWRGTQPGVNQDVKLYIGDTVASIASNVITLTGNFERNTGKFYAGQQLWLRVGNANAEVGTVQSYVESTLTLTLTAAPVLTVNPGNKIGEIQYGGLISMPKNVNLEVLSNLEYLNQCVDYTKLFDKKNIALQWAGVDSRYIINDSCNQTINYNSLVNTLSYTTNGAIQAAWSQAGDGNAPTVDTSDYLEGTAAGVFGWTHAGGTASWVATLSARNVSTWTGVNSGAPTNGQLMIWGECADYTKITSLKLRIGSSSGNYQEVILPKPTSNNWMYRSIPLVSGTTTGTPNWTAMTYAAIVIVETASSSIKLNGFRINADGSFTLNNVQGTSPVFTNLSAPTVRPSSLMQLLAKNFQYNWNIDYNRDIHFTPNSFYPAPFNLGDTTNNFYDLQIELDQSNLANAVIVNGGQETSTNTYSQIFQGDGILREWILKSPFKNISVLLDDNTSSHSAAAGTNTTNIKIVGHGLSKGDNITNRTRGNLTATVTAVVDPDNVTVFPAIAAQTTGDTITFYTTAKTVGQESVDVEASFDFMYNAVNQSVRCSSQTATPLVTTFLRFKYNELLDISVYYIDPTSANTLKAMGFGDGIFDADPVTDANITDQTTAITLAQATINDTRNPLVTVTFSTNHDGLKAGQLIIVQDSVRGVNASYVVQSVRLKKVSGQFYDYFEYDVQAGTTLFGVIEFYQRLLATGAEIASNPSGIVISFVTDISEVGVHAAEALALGGFNSVSESDIVGVNAVEMSYVKAWKSWEYESSSGQQLPTRYDLADYG